ncbi:hypothetical protein Tco_1553419 [Tanacetum coccineum]
MDSIVTYALLWINGRSGNQKDGAYLLCFLLPGQELADRLPYMIVISSYSSSDLERPSKSLLKWYEDLTNEDIEELWFSKLGGKKGQKTSKAKPSFSSIEKAKASILAKASGSFSSKAKASGSFELIMESKINVESRLEKNSRQRNVLA